MFLSHYAIFLSHVAVKIRGLCLVYIVYGAKVWIKLHKHSDGVEMGENV